MIITRWGTDVTVLSTRCSPEIELLSIKVRPFYLPREFNSIILTVVYIPPHVDKTKALDELYSTINGLEIAHPEAAFNVVGDFNRVNLRKDLPKFYQHINLPHGGNRY